MAPALEALDPATQEQWESANRIFAKPGRDVWVEIMPQRFLAHDWGNVGARALDVSLGSKLNPGLDEVLPKLGAVMALDPANEELGHARCRHSLPPAQLFPEREAAESGSPRRFGVAPRAILDRVRGIMFWR